MKLYGFAGACSFVPHTALIMAHADFDLELISHKYAKSPEYLAKNPQGSVPLLEQGGFLLSQNVAILNYLHNRYPNAYLFGKGDYQRQARAQQWLAYANADVHKAFIPLFNPTAFLKDKSQSDNIKQTAKARIVDTLKIANDALAHSEFLSGEFTIADVYLYVTLRWASGSGVDFSKLTQLTGFIARVEAQPAVQQALSEEHLKPIAATA